MLIDCFSLEHALDILPIFGCTPTVDHHGDRVMAVYERDPSNEAGRVIFNRRWLDGELNLGISDRWVVGNPFLWVGKKEWDVSFTFSLGSRDYTLILSFSLQ